MENSHALGQHLPIETVFPSATNPRKRFDDTMLAELAVSIRELGVLQPILVRPLPSIKGMDPTHEIVSGECRYRASKLAEQSTIPAVIRELNDVEAMHIQVTENLQRTDLHALEEAEGIRQLMKVAGLNADQVADKLGKSRSYVYDSLKLLELPESATEAFYEGTLNRSTALLVARLDDTDMQQQVLESIVESKEEDGIELSYRETQELVRDTVQTSVLKKEIAATLDKAKQMAANLEGEGKVVVLLDTSDKRQEWAGYGLAQASWKCKEGYCPETNHVTVDNAREVKINDALTVSEYPGAVYLVSDRAEMMILVKRDDAIALINQKIENKEYTLPPAPEVQKSEWQIEREANEKRAEEEQTRRQPILSEIAGRLEYAQTDDLLSMVTPSMREFANTVFDDLYHAPTQLVLKAYLMEPDQQQYFRNEVLAKMPTRNLIEFITICRAADRTAIDYSWDPEDDDDKDLDGVFFDLARSCGIDPDAEQPSTPPTTALAEELKAPENQEPETTVDDSKLPAGMQKAKAKALAKKAKTEVHLTGLDLKESADADVKTSVAAKPAAKAKGKAAAQATA